MSFLSPIFLAGMAAAAVPIVLHLLKRHTEQRVRFAAVSLLKGAPVEHTARRRLRELLLLSLRVAAVALLSLAFARPFFRAATATSARLTVVAIDTSLSMSAPTARARSRQLADEAIRQAAAGDDVAVVQFADRAEVTVPPTPDRGAALAAVDTMTTGFGSTSYAAGLAAASALFKGRTGTIDIVTDLQSNGWDAGGSAAVPEAVRVDVKDVGALHDNLAVEALRGDGDRVVATIRNAGERARDARTRLTIDGRPAGQMSATIGARSTADVVFANVRNGGVAVATVDDSSGIAGDNARYAPIGGNTSASSLVVTASGDLEKDAWYVRHALPGARGVRAADLSTWTDDGLGRFGAVIVMSTRGLERRGRERLATYVNAGGGVLIAAGPDVDGDVIADVLGSSTPLEIKPSTTIAALSLAPADVRHPVFHEFGVEVASLSLVRFHSMARISGRSCQPIARFSSGDAAVLDCAAGNGRAIVLASDLNNKWNDFPVRASFLPFLDQAIRYLSDAARRGSEYLVGEVPAGVAAVPGVAAVNIGGASRRIVVNVDPKESAADRISAADFQAAITRLKATAVQEVRADVAEHENRQHLWQYLLIAMIVVMASEGVIAARMA